MNRTTTLVGAALLGLAATAFPVVAGHATTAGSAGRIAFVANIGSNPEVMVRIGSVTTNLTNDPGDDIDPAWSPDGTRIAWASERPDAGGDEGHSNIWVMDADGTDAINLTDGAVTTGEANSGVQPTWSPDGSRIAYSYQGDVWVIPAAGGQEVNLMPDPGPENAGTEPSWSPDGTIAFTRNGEIWVMEGDGSNQTQLTSTPHPAAERFPDWSPDGARLVYERQGQVWRMNADGTGQVPVTSGAGQCGTRPEWSPEGDRLVFASQCFTAPNGPDIFTARPDGTKVLRHGLSTTDTEQSPAWQPRAGGTPWGTYTTTGARLSATRVSVSGEVFPANRGGTVKVTLQRKTRDGYRQVAADTAKLNRYGRYAVALERPDATRCRVVAKFLGDAQSSASKDIVTFAC